jgi:hypothetical protein
MAQLVIARKASIIIYYSAVHMIAISGLRNTRIILTISVAISFLLDTLSYARQLLSRGDIDRRDAFIDLLHTPPVESLGTHSTTHLFKLFIA